MISEVTNFVAIDLGASSGRTMLGSWDGARLELRELHRFANGGINVLGHLHWDALHLWAEIKNGLARYAADDAAPLAGIGVDTWGVDFALLDRTGNLLGNPYHYRDSRTDGMMERVFRRVPRREVFNQTGIQFMQINTLYQLFSMIESGDPRLEIADTLLMMPDLFHYWLTGNKVSEYTIASTTQMLNAREQRWATEILASVGVSTRILPDLISPGAVLGQLRSEVMAEAGLKPTQVIAVASHDTASAVAAVPGLDARS
ncbi:MAG: rhamnulokinase, partial [Chloroflexi bacterium]|nr:rhamnulokinase [Chloroflexota bacterium]